MTRFLGISAWQSLWELDLCFTATHTKCVSFAQIYAAHKSYPSDLQWEARKKPLVFRKFRKSKILALAVWLCGFLAIFGIRLDMNLSLSKIAKLRKLHTQERIYRRLI